MSFITRWFKKNEPEDYEQILAALALDIQKRQTSLSEIRLRERRATLLVTMYTLAFWTVYVTMWYTNVLPNFSGRRSNSAFEKLVKGSPVLGGPIVILFTRRITQIWYSRKGDVEEKTLVTLRKQQRERIEDIKKKTNYYTTRNLLERYDEASPGSPSSPLRRTQPIPGTPIQQQQPTPQKTPITPNQHNFQHLAILQQPIQPPRKQWYDKLADALLGDDNSSTPPTSRYALICQKCFAHNGLVMESQWKDTQYVCPKCGHFNPSQRSLDRGSPAAPNSRSDQSGSTTTSPSTTSLPTSSPSLHPTMHAAPQRHQPSNNVRQRRPVEPDGNSSVEMDIDS